MSDLRVSSVAHHGKVRSAKDAALLIAPDTTVELSGFTASGDSTAVPLAFAARVDDPGTYGPTI